MKKSRWNRKIKKWKDSHSHQICQKRRKKAGNAQHKYFNRKKLFDEDGKTVVIIPEKFSLVENTEETMSFFIEFVRLIRDKTYGTHFFIDSQKVTFVTVDALIYLIAILQNDNINIKKKYKYSGNFPQNSSARRVYQESGFTNYVKSKVKELPPNTEKMRIVSGLKNDSDSSKQLCEFVMDKLKKSRLEVSSLYIIFIELMSNVYHHAYDDNDVMLKRWYMYAEHVEDCIRFVFVDTGIGIARTVRRNFKESIEHFIGINAKDGSLLKSTFNGDFRTQTNEKYRGNGLSTVKEKVLTGSFRDFQVISGHGKCVIGREIKNSNHLESMDYKNMVYGTVYTFDFY